jgi:hypothetical protein
MPYGYRAVSTYSAGSCHKAGENKRLAPILDPDDHLLVGGVVGKVKAELVYFISFTRSHNLSLPDRLIFVQ